MRSIAASILILAASIMFVGASLASHNYTSFTLSVIGCIVGTIGLVEWFMTSAEVDKAKSESES